MSYEWQNSGEFLLSVRLCFTLQDVIKGVTDRIDALDGIRGIAILLVIALHWAHPYFPYFPGGYVGVDVFFVLSGFLITSALWKGSARSPASAWFRFERRRIERLYPALIAFLVVGTAFVWFFDEPVSGTQAVGASALALVQMSTFVAGSGSHALGPFGHTWSLSVEWLFYLVWPIIVIATRRRLSPRSMAVATLVLAATLYVASSFTGSTWFYFGPLSRSAQILAGASLALFLASGGSFRVPLFVGAGAVAALAIWTIAGTQEMDPTYRLVGYPLATVSAVCILGCALRQEGTGAKILAWTPLALVGRVSYSLYLWHVLAIQVLTPENVPLPRVGIAALAVVGTAAFTAASYLLLERPVLMRTKRRRKLVALKPTSLPSNHMTQASVHRR